MKARSGRRVAAAWRCLALAVVLSTAGGCVYWRLYRVQRQLANFDEHFDFRHDPGAVVTFHKPTLKVADLEWLLDRPPWRRSAHKANPVWVYRFHKRGDHPDEPAALRIVDVELRTSRGKIRELAFPPQFNPVIDHELFRLAFQGAEDAPVDTREGRTGWTLHRRFQLPNPEVVQELFGAPTSRQETAMHTVWEYQFDLGEHAPEAPEDRRPDAQARFVFSNAVERAERTDVRVGALRAEVWMASTQDGYRLDLRRKPQDADPEE